MLKVPSEALMSQFRTPSESTESHVIIFLDIYMKQTFLIVVTNCQEMVL